MPMRILGRGRDAYVLAGYLEKKGKWTWQWADRYFVLTPSALHYFKKDKSQLFGEERGHFLVEDMIIRPQPDKRSFEIFANEKQRLLRAPTEREYLTWAKAFQDVLQARYGRAESLAAAAVRKENELINNSPANTAAAVAGSGSTVAPGINRTKSASNAIRRRSASPNSTIDSSPGLNRIGSTPSNRNLSINSELSVNQSAANNQSLMTPAAKATSLFSNSNKSSSNIPNSSNNHNLINQDPRTDPLLLVTVEHPRSSTDTDTNSTGSELIAGRAVNWNHQLLIPGLTLGSIIVGTLGDGTKIKIDSRLLAINGLNSNNGESLIEVRDRYRPAKCKIRWNTVFTPIMPANKFKLISQSIAPAIFIILVILLLLQSGLKYITSTNTKDYSNNLLLILTGLISCAELFYILYRRYLAVSNKKLFFITFVGLIESEIPSSSRKSSNAGSANNNLLPVPSSSSNSGNKIRQRKSPAVSNSATVSTSSHSHSHSTDSTSDSDDDQSDSKSPFPLKFDESHNNNNINLKLPSGFNIDELDSKHNEPISINTSRTVGTRNRSSAIFNASPAAISTSTAPSESYNIDEELSVSALDTDADQSDLDENTNDDYDDSAAELSKHLKGILPPLRQAPWGQWTEDDTSKLLIRGSTYLADHKKIPAGLSIYKLAHCDMFHTGKEKYYNVGNRIESYASIRYEQKVRSKSIAGNNSPTATATATGTATATATDSANSNPIDPNAPHSLSPMIIVNLMYPGPENNNYNLVLYFVRRVRPAELLKKQQAKKLSNNTPSNSNAANASIDPDSSSRRTGSSNSLDGDADLDDSDIDINRVAAFDKILTQFLREPVQSNDPQSTAADKSIVNNYRDNCFKIIPRIAEGSWFVRTGVGCTPAILGRKIAQSYHRDLIKNYFEIDADVGSSIVAGKILTLVKSAATSLVIELSFLFEGHTIEELPESLISGCRLVHVDLGKILHYDENCKKNNLIIL